MNVQITVLTPQVLVGAEEKFHTHVYFVRPTYDAAPGSGIGAKTINDNGTYYAGSDGLQGYGEVTVNVSGGGGSTLIEKTVNANGVYNASSDSADGYSKVTVNVPASAVDTGTKSISTNGTHDVIGYASANVSVPASAVDTGTKSITANGNNQDVVGYAAVDVAVPNTYAAGDEGKVVSGGALVAQTAQTITENGTYDTTTKNSVTVNVSGGGGGLEYEEGTYTAASDSIPTITFTNTHTEAPALVVLMDASDTYINTTAGTMYGLMDFTKLFGVGLKTGPALTRAGCYSHAKSSSGGSTTLGAAVLADPSTQATNTGFTPAFSSATYMCKAGQTYKWIAIWR